MHELAVVLRDEDRPDDLRHDRPAVFGVLAGTLRMKCTSCRRRHEVHYADVRIMPMRVVVPFPGAGSVPLRSA